MKERYYSLCNHCDLSVLRGNIILFGYPVKSANDLNN